MQIFTSVDWDTPFVYLTISYAIKNLTSYINDCKVTLWEYNQFKQRQIEGTTDDCILIFEAGNIPHGGWNISDLKKYFPNSKIVTLCSDTIWWMINGGQQIDNQHEIDLNLELMPQCIEWMQNKGWKVDRWMWTASDLNIKELKELCPQDYIDWQRKHTDLIGVYHPVTLTKRDLPCSNYRYNMVKWLTDNGCSFTQGNGQGHQDRDHNQVYQSYMNSWLNLGTSSHGLHAISHMGCMKGWRDWISPFLNCLLIYDDHPNVQDTYNVDKIIPTYRYEHFDEIKDLVIYYKSNLDIYIEKLLAQRKWAEANTIDKQLVKLMVRHNIITKDLVKCQTLVS